jgi:hypothetical protein
VASGGGRVGLGKGGDQGLAGQGRQRLGLAVQHTSGGVQWREVATGDGHRQRRGWPRATARRRRPIAVAQGQKGGRLGGAGSNSLVRCERERLGVTGG